MLIVPKKGGHYRGGGMGPSGLIFLCEGEGRERHLEGGDVTVPSMSKHRGGGPLKRNCADLATGSSEGSREKEWSVHFLKNGTVNEGFCEKVSDNQIFTVANLWFHGLSGPRDTICLGGGFGGNS